jgi:hypothetical protein
VTVRRLPNGDLALEGTCDSQDAEELLQGLVAAPDSMVDWRACESAHAAVIQVLLAARRRMLGPPAGKSLKDWIAPHLGGASSAAGNG